MVYAFGHITSIPSALHQLYAILAAAYPIDPNGEPVMYWFGNQLGAWSAPTTVEIHGVSPANQEPASLGPDYLREEVFAVNCKVTVFGGDATTATGFLANMDAVWTVWIALETAIANNPQLNGTVRYAECGEMAYEPTTDGKGIVCGSLTWVIRCSARNYSLS